MPSSLPITLPFSHSLSRNDDVYDQFKEADAEMYAVWYGPGRSRVGRVGSGQSYGNDNNNVGDGDSGSGSNNADGKDGMTGRASESRYHVERDGMAFAKCASRVRQNQCRHARNRPRKKMSEVTEKRVANRTERKRDRRESASGGSGGGGGGDSRFDPQHAATKYVA